MNLILNTELIQRAIIYVLQNKQYTNRKKKLFDNKRQFGLGASQIITMPFWFRMIQSYLWVQVWVEHNNPYTLTYQWRKELFEFTMNLILNTELIKKNKNLCEKK